MRTARIAAATTAVLLAGGLTACSSADGSAAPVASRTAEATPSAAPKELAPKETLLASAAVMTKAGSAKVAMSGSNAGAGVASWSSPAGLQITSKEDGADVQVIVVQNAAYVGGVEDLPSGKKWLKTDIAGGAADPEAGGGFVATEYMLNPAAQLTANAQAGTLTKVGAEQAGGGQAVHYRSAISTDALVKALPQVDEGTRTLVAAGLKEDGANLVFDFWIDAEGRLVQQAVKGDAAGAESTTITYSEIGTPHAVQAPPAAEVVDFAEMMKGLGGQG